MSQVTCELVGGPKDGLQLNLHHNTRVLAIPVALKLDHEFGKSYSAVHYERRMEGGQPVTNYAGNLLFDYKGFQ